MENQNEPSALASEISVESKKGKFIGFTSDSLFMILEPAMDDNLKFENFSENIKTITNYQAVIGYIFTGPFEVQKQGDNYLVASTTVDDFSHTGKKFAFLVRNKILLVTFAAEYPLDNDHHHHTGSN